MRRSLPMLPFPEPLLEGTVVSIVPCMRGDAADAYRVEMEDGRLLFAKTSRKGTSFRMEALGLTRMAAATEGVRVPKVVTVSDDWLILEFIEFGRPAGSFQETLGRELAATHRLTHDAYGFDEDHAIGMSPQINTPTRTVTSGAWRSFWWTHRLEPMIRYLPSPALQSKAAKLENRLETWIPDHPGQPSLLHGDLWSGNVAADSEGHPLMFDPAPYYGYREAELGMTAMFGGFSETFYQAYDEAWPLPEGWRDRMNFYMLYHVMNHAVLFQGSYLLQTERLLHELL